MNAQMISNESIVLEKTPLLSRKETTGARTYCKGVSKEIKYPLNSSENLALFIVSHQYIGCVLPFEKERNHKVSKDLPLIFNIKGDMIDLA